MSYPRDFADTIPTEPARLATELYSGTARRTDRWLNRLLAIAIGAALAWWLWEWAAQCLEALTCGLAMVRPMASTAQSVNEERLHAAVDAAHRHGRAEGYQAGFTAGARYGRVLHVGAGVVLGALLVAGALNLGLRAGAGA